MILIKLASKTRKFVYIRCSVCNPLKILGVNGTRLGGTFGYPFDIPDFFRSILIWPCCI